MDSMAGRAFLSRLSQNTALVHTQTPLKPPEGQIRWQGQGARFEPIAKTPCIYKPRSNLIFSGEPTDIARAKKRGFLLSSIYSSALGGVGSPLEMRFERGLYMRERSVLAIGSKRALP